MGEHLQNPQAYENWATEPWLQVPSPNSWPKPVTNTYTPTPYIWGDQLSDIDASQQEELESPVPSAMTSLADTWSSTWGQSGAPFSKATKLTFKKAGSWSEATPAVQEQLPVQELVENKKDLDEEALSQDENNKDPLASPDLADKKKKKSTIEEELSKQSLYKTELCRSYQETGICRYGHKCQFAHGEHELRPILRHPKYKTEYCQRYAMFGHCPYGNRCRFIHPDRMKNRSNSLGDPVKKSHNADTKNLVPILDLSKAPASEYGSYSGPSTPNSDSQPWSSNWTTPPSSNQSSLVASPRSTLGPLPIANEPSMPSANQTIPTVQPENVFLHPWMLNRRASSESSLLTSMPPVMKPPTTSFVERPNSSDGRRLMIFQNLANSGV